MTSTHLHILVVDDERDSVRFLGNLLGQQGYQVHIADSSVRALAIAGEITRDGRLDLILLDIVMGAGIDGIEICRRLKSRQETRGTPVIFLTGKDDEDTMVRAFDAGGADYVLKPFNQRVLLARVQTHVELGLLSRDLESALSERTRALHQANDRLRHLALEISLTEERERRQLAKDLHDSPMQKLALAQLQLSAAARGYALSSDERFATGLELIREALHELRTLQFELSPPALYRQGLVAALEGLAADASRRCGVPVSFTAAEPIPALDGELAVFLYQCARELVHNLAKHARASSGEIALAVLGEQIVLSVSDDGHGFPPSHDTAPTNASGYGLFSIRERVTLLGGEFSIASGAGGARVSVRVPLAATGAGPRARLTAPGGRDPGGS